jgi:hypothetical protein
MMFIFLTVLLNAINYTAENTVRCSFMTNIAEQLSDL